MVSLKNFDDNWKVFFKKEKERLLSVLSGQDVVSIDHIGATSVVMCKTSGTIDVLVTIQDKIEFFTVKNLLNRFGYEYVDHLSDIFHCLFFLRRNTKRQIICTIRVVENASEEHMKYIGFKQYLKSGQGKVKKYNEARKIMIEKTGGKPAEYQKMKSDYIESILRDYCEVKNIVCTD